MEVRHRSVQLFWVVGLLGFLIYVVSLHGSPVNAAVVAESESEAGDTALVLHDTEVMSSGGTSRPQKLVKRVQGFLRRYAAPIRVTVSAIIIFLVGYYALQYGLRRRPQDGSRRERQPPDEDRQRGRSPETAPERGTGESDSSGSRSPERFPLGSPPASSDQADDGDGSKKYRVDTASLLGTRIDLTRPSGSSDDASQVLGRQGLDVSASKSPPSPASGGKPVEAPLHSTPATGSPSETVLVPADTQSPCCGAKGSLPKETSPTSGIGTHVPGKRSPPSPSPLQGPRLASFFVGSEGGPEGDVVIIHSGGPSSSSGSSGLGDSSVSPSDGDSPTPSAPARGMQQEGPVGGSSSPEQGGRQAQAPISATTASSPQTGMPPGKAAPTPRSDGKPSPGRTGVDKVGGPSRGRGSPSRSPGSRLSLSKTPRGPVGSPTGGLRGRGGSHAASAGRGLLPGPSRQPEQRSGVLGPRTKLFTPKPSWVPPYGTPSSRRVGSRTREPPQSQEQHPQAPSGEGTRDLDGRDQDDSR
ncbi:putative transmembrane protein [Toxoplasma gondii RUB]|uniref:Putative transmembrane protein n=1 Tax=Toxoplasma gondii RUB TaxID=935652 RepID=A0A086M287_TOXGO|nr:putative transmembrane protein [Toxoplasma gondii RUB]